MLSEFSKKCNNSIKNGISLMKRYHVMFLCQLFLIVFTMLSSLCWFIAGKEVLAGCQWFWNVVERGSLEAIVSVMGVIGVSSIIIGWVYSERDKVTLGKSLNDIICHRFGSGYVCSVVIHFGATAQCMLMAKCNAREAAFWAFLTVIWGCIPQARICVDIALNQTKRERCALELWKQESSESEKNRIVVISRMIEALNDVNTRYHKGYRDVLAEVMAAWLKDFKIKDYTSEDRDALFAKCILLISTNFWKIAEKIPEMEHLTFEGEILEVICGRLEENTNGHCGIYLLCCGYIRFLYAQSNGKIDDMVNDVNRLFYYAKTDNGQIGCFERSIKEILYGLEWFMFLEQYSGLPVHIVDVDMITEKNEYIKKAFEQLVLSIFEGKGQERINLARIAWNQVSQQDE